MQVTRANRQLPCFLLHLPFWGLGAAVWPLPHRGPGSIVAPFSASPRVSLAGGQTAMGISRGFGAEAGRELRGWGRSARWPRSCLSLLSSAQPGQPGVLPEHRRLPSPGLSPLSSGFALGCATRSCDLIHRGGGGTGPPLPRPGRVPGAARVPGATPAPRMLTPLLLCLAPHSPEQLQEREQQLRANHVRTNT